MTEISTPWIPNPVTRRDHDRLSRSSTRSRRAGRARRGQAGVGSPLRRFARRMAEHTPTSATPSDRALAAIGHIERHFR